MRRRDRPRLSKGWRGVDEEARRVLGLHRDLGSHYADAGAHASAEKFKFAVIPGSSEGLFAVDGDEPAAVTQARQVLLEQSRFWDEPNISMAFHQFVTGMLYYRTVYKAIQFGGEDPVMLERIDWLAPETIAEKRRGGRLIFEQYVRAATRPEYGPYWCDFAEDEILRLEWPLSSPRGKKSPYQAAIEMGLPEDQLMQRSILGLQATNEPGEQFVTFARARVGQYADALFESQLVSCQVNDALFTAPTEAITEYFEIDRIVRMRIAACDVRDYLIREFNRQVLARWAARNEWGRVELKFVPDALTQQDWAEIRDEHAAGRLTYADVVDLIREDQTAMGRHDRN